MKLVLYFLTSGLALQKGINLYKVCIEVLEWSINLLSLYYFDAVFAISINLFRQVGNFINIESLNYLQRGIFLFLLCLYLRLRDWDFKDFFFKSIFAVLKCFKKGKVALWYKNIDIVFSYTILGKYPSTKVNLNWNEGYSN